MYPNCEIKYRWEAQDCITLDKIPYIGNFSNIENNIYVATGYNKWGITTSNIAAQIITDKIMKRKNKYEDVFTATRAHFIKNMEETKNMIKQTTDSLILKKFTLPKEKLIDLKEDTGKIVDINGEKVGVYKDKSGKLYAVKPICTHLGCELTFNNTLKTWDCPCHGSRFNYLGESISSPSIENLEVYEIENK